MAMNNHPKVLHFWLLSAVLISGALSASYTVGDVWLENDEFVAENMASSSHSSKMILTGPKNIREYTMSATFTTWTPEGLDDTLSFAILPEGYSKCQYMVPGFMQEPSLETKRYLAWTCSPSQNEKTTHFFFAKLESDGTVVTEKVFKPTEETSVQGLPVAFLNTMLVAVINSGFGQILLGLDSELEVEFEMTVPTYVQLGALTSIPGTDKFVVGGSYTINYDIYLATFERGMKHKETLFSLPSNADVFFSDIAASSSRLLVTYGLDHGIQTTLLNLDDFSVVKTLKLDSAYNGGFQARVTGDTFGVVYPNGYEFAAWVFDDTLEQTNSLYLEDIDGYKVGYGSVVLAEGRYLVLGTAIVNTDMTKVLGSAVWGYDLTSTNSKVTEAPAMHPGIDIVAQDITLDWITSSAKRGELTAETNTTYSVFPSGFKTVVGDERTDAAISNFLAQLLQSTFF